MSGPDAPRPSGGRRRRRILWRSRRVFYALAVLVVVGLGGVWMVLNTIELPPEKRPIETTFVCDIDVPDQECDFDTSMAQITSAEERVLVTYEELPPILVQAVLATEDRKFFDHNGIDPLGISRAVVRDVLGDSQSQQGGSTITQQYVKSVYLTPERSLQRKLREAVLAVKLEQELDKREILTRYLNEVYFGRGAYGVEAASRAYFGVPVGDLQLYQAAYLAGLIRSPETADASRDPEEATRRRNATLTAMEEMDLISAEEADAAAEIPWIFDQVGPDGEPLIRTVLPRREVVSDFGEVRHADVGSEYWLELVRTQLRQRFGTGAETRGLRVYTTFDPELQRAAHDAVWSVLDEPDAPLGSLVAVDADGRVRAMVGGRSYAENKVNLALGKEGGGSGRPAGSTFKTFALAAFVEDGYSIESRFEAPPTTSFPGVFTSPGKLWEPANYDRRDRGVQTVEEATWSSTNTVYAGMVDQVTPERTASMARRLGVRSDMSAVYSLVLGTAEVSVMDMASAYSTLANGGRHVDPYVIRRVEDADGNVLYDAGVEVVPEQVVSEEVADTVAFVLRGVVISGTGSSAAIQGVPVAGKTGTTNDSKDSWFAGFTCHMTTVVWMGHDRPEKMVYKGREVAGGNYPAQIWRAFMREATAGEEPCDFPETDAGERLLNQRMRPSSQTTTTAAPSTTEAESEDTSTTEADTTSTTVAPTTAPPTTAAPTTVPPTAPVATTVPPG